ncbi:MAG TPA: DUF945 family protein [Aquirhabdus sp.]
MTNKPYAKIGAAVFIALGATWLGTTWYGGQQIMKQYPEALTKLSGSELGAMKFVITKQEAGFFSSHINWDLIITPNPCAPNATFKISGYDDIRNGLIPSLGFGQVQSHIIWPESAKPFLTKMFGEKEPLRITTTMGLLGELTSKISSPIATYKDEKGTLDWKGLSGSISRSRDEKNSDTEIDFAGVHLTNSQQQFVIQLDKISYESHLDQGASGLGLGKSELSVSGLNVEKDGKTYGFKKLDINSDASEKDGFFAVGVKANVESFLRNGQTIGKFDMAFHADHIDAKALKNVNDLFKKVRSECKPNYDGLIQAAQPIFAKGVHATLKNVDLELFDGKAHAEGKAKLPSLSAAEVQDPKLGLLKLEIDGKANFTEKLISAIVGVMLESNSQGQPVDPQLKAQVVAQMLEKPLSAGLIVKAADEYTSSFQVRQGKTIVNGKALN